MKIETNVKMIRRNARIAQIASLSGLVVLIGGMVISFTNQELISLSFLALLVGFILSQVGIYFTNRWGRSPRPDEQLDKALKGLDNKYTIYHYTTPISHLLVGPAGLWVLVTRNQRGTITFSNGRWRQKGGGLLQSYLKLFAQEGIGRPELEISNNIEKIQNYLSEQLADGEVPPIEAALIFTHNDVDIQIDDDEDNTLAPTIYLNKLKNHIRKTAKTKPIPLNRIEEIQEALG